MDEGGQPERSRTTVAKRTSWSYRYVQIALILLALCLPAIFFYSGYHQLSFNEVLSFKIDDGWCVKGVQSIGAHCFGDYAGVDAGIRVGNFWKPGLPTSTAYPPLAIVPSLAFVYLGRAAGSWALGRDLFLLLLAGSLLTPAVWASRRGWSERGPISFLILGLASAPFLIVLDRGNTAGLLVAPLLGVATAYMNQQHRRMMFFIVVCTLLKPQMLLLALLFVIYRAYKYLVLTGVVSVALTFAGFLVFPGGLSDNIHNWLHMAKGYGPFQTVGSPYPYNLGVGRSILTTFDLTRLGSLTGTAARTHLVTWLQAHTGMLSVLVIALTIAMIYARRQDTSLLYPFVVVCIAIAIAPGTSYSYYVALFLVPAAFVLRDPLPLRRQRGAPAQWSGIFDRGDSALSRWDQISRWMLISGFALLLAPLAIPVSSISLLGSTTPFMEVGLLQVLWGPILVVLFVLSIAMAVVGPKRAPAPVSITEVTRPTVGAST